MTSYFIQRFILACGFICFLSANAGYIEDGEGKTILHLELYSLPDPDRKSLVDEAERAANEAFCQQFPDIIRERYAAKYKANPELYGVHDWDNVSIVLHKYRPTTEGTPTSSIHDYAVQCLQVGDAGEIVYVSFRSSAEFIAKGFLAPLDDYVNALPAAEKELLFPEKIVPVVHRKGPDGQPHWWAKPTSGLLGKVMLYRKDLLAAKGIAPPGNDWTWEELYWNCRKLTDPENGTYGLLLGRGSSESWYWTTYLWSAGGEVEAYDEEHDRWMPRFNSEAAARAMDFYLRLSSEPWLDAKGHLRHGYSADTALASRDWHRGRIGFMQSYIEEIHVTARTSEQTAMVPVPLGPPDPGTGRRMRGSELNSRMHGIYSGVRNPVLRDAAWEYMRFVDGLEAWKIRVDLRVDHGFGTIVHPRYLRQFGYDELVKESPENWAEACDIALQTGVPEPYGRSESCIYEHMTVPLQVLREMLLQNRLAPFDRGAVKTAYGEFAAYAEAHADDAEIAALLKVYKRCADRPLLSDLEYIHHSLAGLTAADAADPALVAQCQHVRALLDANETARLAIIRKELEKAARAYRQGDPP